MEFPEANSRSAMDLEWGYTRAPEGDAHAVGPVDLTPTISDAALAGEEQRMRRDTWT
jgi:hypothetical protein